MPTKGRGEKKDGTLRHTQGRGWERSIDDGPWTVGTGEGLGREILRCAQDRLSAIRAGRGRGGRLEGGDVWAIHLYALQFSNPVCRLGDAILYQVPGTLMEDFIVAKTAWNALRFPGIRMIH